MASQKRQFPGKLWLKEIVSVVLSLFLLGWHVFGIAESYESHWQKTQLSSPSQLKDPQDKLFSLSPKVLNSGVFIDSGLSQRIRATLSEKQPTDETVRDLFADFKKYAEHVLDFFDSGDISREIVSQVTNSTNALLANIAVGNRLSHNEMVRRYIELNALVVAAVHGQYWQSPSHWTSTDHYRGIFQHNTTGGVYERSSLSPVLIEEVTKFQSKINEEVVLFNNLDSAFTTLTRYLFQTKKIQEGSSIVISPTVEHHWKEQIVRFAHRYGVETSSPNEDTFWELAQEATYLFLNIDASQDKKLFTGDHTRLKAIVLFTDHPLNIEAHDLIELSRLGIHFFVIQQLKHAFDDETDMTSLGLVHVMAPDDNEVAGNLRVLRKYGGSVSWFMYDFMSLLLRGQLDENQLTRNSTDLYYPIKARPDAAIPVRLALECLRDLKEVYQRLEPEVDILMVPTSLAPFKSILDRGVKGRQTEVEQLLIELENSSQSVSYRVMHRLARERQTILVLTAVLRLLYADSKRELRESHREKLEILEDRYRRIYSPLPGQSINEPVHQSLLFNSGMGAIETLFHYLYFYPDSPLSAGGTMVVGQYIYFGVRAVLQAQMPPYDVRVVEVDETKFSNIAGAIEEHNANIVFLDPLANHILMSVADIQKVIAYTSSRRRNRPFFLIVDSAVLGPLFQPAELIPRGLELPKDYYIVVTRSLQKVDQEDLEVTAAGEITVFSGDTKQTQTLIDQLKQIRETNGNILNSLSTEEMSLFDISVEASRPRIVKQSQNALNIARRLDSYFQQKSPQRKIYYPRLERHPEHNVAMTNYEIGHPFLYIQLEYDQRKPEHEIMRRRFLEILFEEASERRVEIIKGESFGFSHTRVEYFFNYLGELGKSVAIVGLRVSPGTEDYDTNALMSDAFVAAFNRFDEEINGNFLETWL